MTETGKAIRRALAVPVVGAVALSLPLTAEAQAEQAIDAGEVEEIIVTGSRLVRRDFSAPSPITSIDREALEFSGQAMLEAALNKLPQITPDFGRSANNPGDGTARVNLRGLGSGRTLVMLNGRRVGSAGIGSSVDVNSLPQALMQRVEIITGGATTVYGSDAVAGVINFITRNDFEGFGLDASAYTTEEGDANIYDINITYGHQFASGNGNITAFVGHYDREPLFMSDREISQFAWFDTWEGSLEQGGSSAVPAGSILAPRIDYGDGNGPVRTIFDQNGDPRGMVFPDDLYNYAPVNYLQSPAKRYYGGVFLNYDLSDRVETYVELTHTQTDPRANLAPVPIFAPLTINLDNPTLTPATQQLMANNLFPAGPNLVAGFFTRRMLEAGARILDGVFDYSRGVVGLKGDLGDNWEFDTWVIYNKTDQENIFLNGISFSRFQQGLLVDPVTNQCYDPSNGCVPINMFGEGNMSPEAVEFIRSRPLSNPVERTQKSFNAYIRGAPFATWAGDVQVAFGVEWRSDEGFFEADPLLFANDILGYNGDAPVVGKENVSEFYAEAIVPLAENTAWAEYLALEIGARYSEYDHAGSVDTWKAGFEWLPSQSFRVRSMVQRSVRAPNLLEAFQEQFTNVFPFVANSADEDPCSASANPVQTGNVEKCVLQGIPQSEIGTWEATIGLPVTVFNGGNPNLTPEVAETFTLGFVIAPDSLPNLQLSFDYFDLSVEDTIGNLQAFVACFDAMNPTGLFCDSFVRDPVTYDVVEIRQTKINKGVLETSGIDTQIDWTFDLPAAWSIGDAGANMTIDMVWTHMLENAFQETSFGTRFDCAGKFGWPCNDNKVGTTYPTNRITTNFNYLSGDTNIYLNWRWIEGTDNAAPLGAPFVGFPDPILQIPSIGSKSYFDLGIAYRFSDNITARLTIANLADTDPAFMADAGDSANTDPGMYDVFGRSYTLSFSLQY